MAAVLIRHGMHYMESPRGLAPRALRDIQAGIATGRFQPTDPRLARAAVAGALLATLQLALTDPGLVDDAAIDHFAEQALRMLGAPYDRGARPRPRPPAGRRAPRTPLTPEGGPATATSSRGARSPGQRACRDSRPRQVRNAARGRKPADGGVVSVMVVQVQPARQGRGACRSPTGTLNPQYGRKRVRRPGPGAASGGST